MNDYRILAPIVNRCAQDGSPTLPCPLCGIMPESAYRTMHNVRYYQCRQHSDGWWRDARLWDEYAQSTTATPVMS